MSQPHLFVDVSSHGFGHLAQVAPILNEFARIHPDCRITLRSGLPPEKLHSRIHCDFAHIYERSDFGYVMLDAVRIDFAATAEAYRTQHANWQQRVDDEADALARIRPDLVLTDVAYLPLAGAAKAGIASLSMCSLNWAVLFAHYFGRESWAKPIQDEMLAAYRAAGCFLRLTPAMPMPELQRTQAIPTVAAIGHNRRDALVAQLNCPPDSKLVLIAFGGFDKNLSAEHWPCTEGVHYLIPQSWSISRADMSATEPLGLHFTDLLASVDAVLTKPGYGTFTEAACNGTAVIFSRRDDWPEQECLIDWLKANSRCLELSETALLSGGWVDSLAGLWEQASPCIPRPTGTVEAARLISAHLPDRNLAHLESGTADDNAPPANTF